MIIEIVGAGCPNCARLAEHAKKAVEETGINAEVKHITDMDEIIKRGIMMTPALVIDGEVKFSGKVVSIETIKEVISGK